MNLRFFIARRYPMLIAGVVAAGDLQTGFFAPFAFSGFTNRAFSGFVSKFEHGVGLVVKTSPFHNCAGHLLTSKQIPCATESLGTREITAESFGCSGELRETPRQFSGASIQRGGKLPVFCVPFTNSPAGFSVVVCEFVNVLCKICLRIARHINSCLCFSRIADGSIISNFAYMSIGNICGSGTTIIAAHNLNRRCYAMEISEKYGAVILERFHTATGIAPELID